MINKTNLKYLCCNSANLIRILNLIKEGQISNLKLILLMQEPSNEELHLAEVARIELRYYCMEIKKFRNYGEPDIHNIYTIALTSGVSSDIKLCNITIKNLLSAIYEVNLSDLITSANHSYLSYVPMSFIYERVLLYKAIKSKAIIAFSDWNTGEIADDIKIIKPTMIVGVPMLLEKIYDTVKARIVALSGARLLVLTKAFNSKLENYKKTGEVTHKF